jgi:LuxR family maltose regulon positive regulatory protein
VTTRAGLDAAQTLRARARRLTHAHPRARPPALADGTVDRPRLRELVAAPATRVALVVAPAGYGKTTLLAQCAGADARPVQYLLLSDADNDANSLLARVVLALDDAVTVPDAAFSTIVFSTADLSKVVLPRLGALIAESPSLLVMFDDLHAVTNRASADIVATVVEHAPSESSVVLASRHVPDVPLARWRVDRALVDVRHGDLAMSQEEAGALMRGANVERSRKEVAALVDVTEGWPAGLYLSTLSTGSGHALGDAPVGGDDRVVAEYFLEEVLRAASFDQVEFLTRTSILGRMSGALCDALLERSDSATMLAGLERSNLFVVPLEGTRGWYRYHQLFAELLRAELRRREPGLEPVLHERASEWWEHQADVSAAIEHAHAAVDLDRVTSLAWMHLLEYAGTGRTSTVVRWLEPFTREEIAARPALALTAAWAAFAGGGDPLDLERWVTVLRGQRGDELLPDGTPLFAAVGLVMAQLGSRGLHRAQEDALLAFEYLPPASGFRSLACLLQGMASRLLGEDDAARAVLEGGRRLAIMLPAVSAHCAAQLAMLAADTGQWPEAQRLVDEALAVVDEYGLSERAAMCEVFAIASLVRAQAGRSDAKDLAKHGAWLVTTLHGVAPHAALEARILLARSLALVGEIDTARGIIGEAATLLADYPDPGRLPEFLADAKSRLDAIDAPLGVTASPLTPAELRVLTYLPTHLSFAEIAEESYVSRNTVKTQAIAVYRKLGVSSRGAAVERARAAGLLEL